MERKEYKALSELFVGAHGDLSLEEQLVLLYGFSGLPLHEYINRLNGLYQKANLSFEWTERQFLDILSNLKQAIMEAEGKE